MREVSLETALSAIRSYLQSSSCQPYFVVADGSEDYKAVLRACATLRQMHISDYCDSDAFPDYDAFLQDFAQGAEDILVLGLGESVSLTGQMQVLRRIQAPYLPGKRVVLCRGVRWEIQRWQDADRKFNARRVCILASQLDYRVVRVEPGLYYPGCGDFRSLLQALERGEADRHLVQTELPLQASQVIASDYEAVCARQPHFPVPAHALSPAQWAQYNEDLSRKGETLLDWRVYLELCMQPVTDSYLCLVMDRAPTYDAYRKRLYNALLDVSVEAPDFWELYETRKKHLQALPDDVELHAYISLSLQKGPRRIYYLTDNTPQERSAIFQALVLLGEIPDVLGRIYPALSDYLDTYRFHGTHADLFTQYFTEYKRQKVLNLLEPAFLAQVNELAGDGKRPYNMLETRSSVVERLDNGKNALYWVDALGVEYLAYICHRAEALELLVHIDVCRAVLPSYTTLNNDFFTQWRGEKEDTKTLDLIKHNKEATGGKAQAPMYLMRELAVIDQALTWARDALAQGRTELVVIASDHGASRFAVLHDSEVPHEMAEKGQHSGRCCPVSETDEKPNSATRERDFWVLANYDRFKGGRRADIEVHGGATLEEVLVPVIQLRLRQSQITLQNLTEIAYSSYREDPEILIFCTAHIADFYLRLQGHVYPGEPTAEYTHKVVLQGWKQAGDYTADVYDGDSRLGCVPITVQKRSGLRMSMDEDAFFQ